MFTITAHPGVKLIMAIWDVIVTTDLDTSLFAYLFILYSCSSLHHPNQLMLLLTPHIRFPKFTYVDEKFLGEFWESLDWWDQVLSINLY
jgi:hypothetical protein